ncbi:hypothetical protein BDV29DRAFT_187983 [Aspergillus leporis]|uniref:Alpha-acetolactate decarboxylase n=1 Tax=Aspergillus leporis TaxID=41062 RepID=A0A5N5XCH2_9EURO|nr:hypothetical protein BDV29DRAFT_187983 [Aspergillus leporis]
MSPNSLYQYYVFSALMQGLAETGPTIGQVLSHGDHGFGTAYHFTPDNQLRKVETTDTFPFIMITHFRPTLTKQLHSMKIPSLYTALSPLLPSKQYCLSVRVDSVSTSNGFMSPDFICISISDDRTAGGHVTGFETGDAKLSAAMTKE